MFQKFNQLPFAAKLLIVYICSLAFAICTITYNQIHTAAAVLEEESTQNLKMLTEQVALNFSEHQQSTSYSIYSRMAALGIPSLMDACTQAESSGTTQASLRYALAQTVTDSSEYDYVVLELADGTRLNSGWKTTYLPGVSSAIHSSCIAILEQYQAVTYGNSNWYRGEDGGVYILRDVYTTSPLRRVGKAVIHMKQSLFSVSDVYENTGFLFFDGSGNYLSSAGTELPEQTREKIVSDVQSGVLSSQESWSQLDYYTVSSVSGNWLTVGVSSTSVYQQMVRRIVQNGIFYGCLGLMLGIGVLAVLIRILTQKLTELRKAMTRVAEGDFSQHIPVTGSDDISRLADTMNYMTERIRELLDELVEKERMKKDAEIQILEYKYRSLETQIRPHFIYNALETINAMAKIQGNTEIAEIVQRISRYFRSITVNTTRQFITCQQEFDMLQDYTEIYRLIYGNRLTTTFSAKEAARNALIPTMILQPVVENALQHGVRAQDEASELIVHAYVTDDRLNITVKDSGYGLSPQMEQKLQSGQTEENKQGGIGVANVRQRLQLIYGSNAAFTIGNRPEGGVVVKIIIPLTYIEPDILGSDDLEWELEE